MRLVDTLRLFRSLLPLGFGASFAATTPKPARHASAGTLIVRVIDAQSHAPIPNAQVTDVDVSVQRLKRRWVRHGLNGAIDRSCMRA